MSDPNHPRDQAQEIRKLVEQLAQTESQIKGLVPQGADLDIHPHRNAVLLLHAAQEALRESQARYHQLITRLAAIVFELEPDGTIVFVNDAITATTGYTPQELRGANFWSLFFPRERQQQVEGLRALLRDHDLISHPVTVANRTGADVVLELSTANRYHQNGELAGIVGFAVDVTEHKRAEEQLRQAAAVFESTSNAILITDREGRILAVNRAFITITGYTREDVLGRHPRLMKSGRHDIAFYQRLWGALAERGQWEGEIWNRRKNGEIYPVWENISVVKDLQGRVVNYVSVFSDLSGVKESQAKLDYLAHHDTLTGAANRLLFRADLQGVIERARRRDERFALLFIDLDRFKAVNDMYGHEAGDAALRIVADRIRENIRTEDTFARVGGDQFVIIMDKITDPKDAAILAEKLIGAISRPQAIAGKELQVGASVGISLFPEDAQMSDGLVKAADTAMRSAKTQGPNTYEFSTAEMTEQAYEYFRMESNLRRALPAGQLQVKYQPQISLKDGGIIGVEALIRWQHPEMDIVLPERFIKIAEDSGLIYPIGEWVMRTACREVKAWGVPLRLSVNVSARQLLRKPILDQVPGILSETQFPAHQLEIEFTESVLCDSEKSRQTLERLRSLGVRFAIDDFGTGYSSLSQLRHLPIDTLKIDQSFIRDVPGDRDSEEIVTAIIAMGHSLELEVIAEGVETPAQLGFLQAQGCDALQGFLFSKPVTADAMRALLDEHKKLPLERVTA